MPPLLQRARAVLPPFASHTPHPSPHDRPDRERRQFAGLALLGLGWPLASPAQAQTPQALDAFWQALKQPGHVALMRHALTDPGVGDPPQFRLGDCRTQRNLSEAGREQSLRIGQAFRRERLRIADVRSSAWCRCVETAQLAFGAHTVWPPINSFFQDGDREGQTRSVLRALPALLQGGTVVLVTHQVNITALTGETLAMGDILVARPDPAGAGTSDRLRVVAHAQL